MNKQLVKFTLHGDLGEKIPPIWNLDVSSVSQGLYAIEVNTKKLFKYFYDKQKEGVGFRILVNGNDLLIDNEEKNAYKAVLNSELFVNKNNLRTVDVIPILIGAAPGLIIAAVILGVGVIGAVITYLLAVPPKFDDFREIESGGKVSYLFNGPYNVSREGGPVPVGYGSLLVGSQVISSSYIIADYLSEKPTGIETEESPYNSNQIDFAESTNINTPEDITIVSNALNLNDLSKILNGRIDVQTLKKYKINDEHKAMKFVELFYGIIWSIMFLTLGLIYFQTLSSWKKQFDDYK